MTPRQKRLTSVFRILLSGVCTLFSAGDNMHPVLLKHADHIAVYTKRVATAKRHPYIWQKTNTEPFHELLLSWNARRPTKGLFVFDIRIQRNGVWGPWLAFAEWGNHVQKTFADIKKDQFAVSVHCRVLVKNHFGTGFMVRVRAKDGASITGVDRLTVCVSNPDYHRLATVVDGADKLPSVLLTDFRPHSQFLLDHEHNDSICSPTATSVVVDHLRRKMRLPSQGDLREVIPLFAEQVRDQEIKIYGNWPLNVAQAYEALDGKAWCSMQRLNSFVQLHSYLEQGLPVVVSVRGPLPGAASAIKNGHLIVIVGWDQKKQEVICLDSAFKNTHQLVARYKLADFAKAWHRSRRTSYIFEVK